MADDGMTLDKRLQALAHRLDDAASMRHVDIEELDNIRACLEEESTRVFNYMKDHGVAL